MCLIDVHHKLRSGHGIPDAVNPNHAIELRYSIHVRVEPEYAGLSRKVPKSSAECLHVSNQGIGRHIHGIRMAIWCGWPPLHGQAWRGYWLG